MTTDNPPIQAQQRIIAIGDIHGCPHTLDALLRKISPQQEDLLVFLGDYIDRGPSTRETIDRLIELRDTMQCCFIMGNHEQMLIDSLERADPSVWLDNGGTATLASYNLEDPSQIPARHLDFIRSCSYFHETPEFIFVHGGLDPEMTVRDNLAFLQPQAYCWMRRHLEPQFLQQSSKRWEKTVVCAHTPTEEVILHERLISIDTGCVYTNRIGLGKLTAVVLPERHILQEENLDIESA
ncbi:metallophosphoesterase family protein [Prosthecochloris vibrioformis]|uniref:Serine/threonine protein phosphatase n=1 Tax=Prosthecochloris vibrioformis TaxID=1098 RepID=A0A5C4S0G3_PROVB|nr:metallophosphoesterase family protein [Prosthecochloris vibrioformis]TNJ36688.1 serine/threonine protein phosphatase [Prosthecochloris vibrioformis]